MSENGKSKLKPSRILLILVFILPLFLWFGREIVTGQTIWFFRAADLADMVIVAPIYAIFLIYLILYMVRNEPPLGLLVAFIAFSFLFMYGHSMHATANTINTYSTEVQDYKDILPQDTYALIYFLDEVLSHIILFVATTGLIGCWLIFEESVQASSLFPQNPIFIFIIGIIYGFVQSYAAVEAQMVWILIFMFSILLVIWFYYWRRSSLSLPNFLRENPFSSFVVIMALFSFIATLTYGAIYGGFPQPSETGL